MVTGGSGTRAISKRYPVTSGIIAETTKQKGRISNLVPQEGSKVLEKEKKGIIESVK